MYESNLNPYTVYMFPQTLINSGLSFYNEIRQKILLIALWRNQNERDNGIQRNWRQKSRDLCSVLFNFILYIKSICKTQNMYFIDGILSTVFSNTWSLMWILSFKTLLKVWVYESHHTLNTSDSFWTKKNDHVSHTLTKYKLLKMNEKRYEIRYYKILWLKYIVIYVTFTDSPTEKEALSSIKIHIQYTCSDKHW